MAVKEFFALSISQVVELVVVQAKMRSISFERDLYDNFVCRANGSILRHFQVCQLQNA